MSKDNRTVAFGRFEKRDEHIFRTKAWLQWGESEEISGMLIMLNPGASKLQNERDWQALENGNQQFAYGPIEIDQTMKAVIEIINDAFESFSGRLEIRNLFNLRNGNMDKALKTYKQIRKTVEEQILHVELEEVSNSPWVWLGWGCDSSLLLKKRKELVYNKIMTWEVPKFSVPKPNEPAYLVGHVKPQLAGKRENYKKEIIRQIKEYIKRR